MPAADISEQISLAGTEASGTGNMKLMMNGAVTLGTLDGANVEIHEAVGDDNILIFGMTTSEVEDSRKMGYNPQSYYYNNPVLKDVIDMINSGINGKSFSEIGSQLISSDPYMVMADFADYCRVHDLAMGYIQGQKALEQDVAVQHSKFRQICGRQGCKRLRKGYLAHSVGIFKIICAFP